MTPEVYSFVTTRRRSSFDPCGLPSSSLTSSFLPFCHAHYIWHHGTGHTLTTQPHTPLCSWSRLTTPGWLRTRTPQIASLQELKGFNRFPSELLLSLEAMMEAAHLHSGTSKAHVVLSSLTPITCGTHSIRRSKTALTFLTWSSFSSVK